MDRILRTGGGRPRVGMTAHTWGWPPTRGDGGFAPRDGRSHLGMAGLHLETATHTWLWRVYVWRWPKKWTKKRKAGVFSLPFSTNASPVTAAISCGGRSPNPGEYQAYNHQPRTRVQGFGNGGKSMHAKRQPRTIFFKAPCTVPVFGINPRNTYKPQGNPSVISMKPRVYKPQKMGGSWDSNGGWFSLPCFLK